MPRQALQVAAAPITNVRAVSPISPSGNLASALGIIQPVAASAAEAHIRKETAQQQAEGRTLAELGEALPEGSSNSVRFGFNSISGTREVERLYREHRELLETDEEYGLSGADSHQLGLQQKLAGILQSNPDPIFQQAAQEAFASAQGSALEQSRRVEKDLLVASEHQVASTTLFSQYERFMADEADAASVVNMIDALASEGDSLKRGAVHDAAQGMLRMAAQRGDTEIFDAANAWLAENGNSKSIFGKDFRDDYEAYEHTARTAKKSLDVQVELQLRTDLDADTRSGAILNKSRQVELVDAGLSPAVVASAVSTARNGIAEAADELAHNTRLLAADNASDFSQLDKKKDQDLSMKLRVERAVGGAIPIGEMSPEQRGLVYNEIRKTPQGEYKPLSNFLPSARNMADHESAALAHQIYAEMKLALPNDYTRVVGDPTAVANLEAMDVLITHGLAQSSQEAAALVANLGTADDRADFARSYSRSDSRKAIQQRLIDDKTFGFIQNGDSPTNLAQLNKELDNLGSIMSHFGASDEQIEEAVRATVGQSSAIFENFNGHEGSTVILGAGKWDQKEIERGVGVFVSQHADSKGVNPKEFRIIADPKHRGSVQLVRTQDGIPIVVTTSQPLKLSDLQEAGAAHIAEEKAVEDALLDDETLEAQRDNVSTRFKRSEGTKAYLKRFHPNR